MEYQETPLGTLEIVSDPSQFESFISPGRGRGRGGVAGPGLRGGRGSFNSNKFIDFNKPWISQSIKSEIWKRKSLSEAARRSKSAVDVAALEKQSEFVESLISDAKIRWLASHPELESSWLDVLAAEERERTYYCDVCERQVGGEPEWREHVSQHATCGIDGCTYTAHQDVLEKHIRHQHLTGFYQRIVQGNSPEDIEKWRQERRKNWPTQLKIAEKIVEKEALKERGEVMDLKRERRKAWQSQPQSQEPEKEWMCNCKARQYLESIRGRRNRAWLPRNIRHQRHCAELENIRERAREKREKRQEKFMERKAASKGVKSCQSDTSEPERKRRRAEDDSSDSEDEKCNGGLRMFRGTVHMIQERERKLREKSNVLEPSPRVSRDLVSYEDDDSGDDEGPEEMRTVVSYENDNEPQKPSEATEPIEVRKPRKKRKKPATCEPAGSNPPVPGEEDQEVVGDEEEGTEDISEEKAEEMPEEPLAVPGPRAEADKLPAVFRKRLRQPTLLERLLLSEIKKERNSILQCVRYVCKNNFFQE